MTIGELSLAVGICAEKKGEAEVNVEITGDILAVGKESFGAIINKNCGAVLGRDGKLRGKVCGAFPMGSADYYNGLYAFVSREGRVYLMNEEGKLVKSIYTGYPFGRVVGLGPKGFVACYYDCAFFDLKGEKKWVISSNVVLPLPNPVYLGSGWLIADGKAGRVFIVDEESGEVVKTIKTDDRFEHFGVCPKHVIVATGSFIEAYDLENGEMVKRVKIPSFFSMRMGTLRSDCRPVLIASDQYYGIIDLMDGQRVLNVNAEGYASAVGSYRDSFFVLIKDEVSRIVEVSVEVIRPKFVLVPE